MSRYAFYVNTAQMALESIIAHKLRTFLTLIGIIIGVASVVLVGASIDGLNRYVVETIGRVLGANHFMIARIAVAGRMTQEEWERMDKRNKQIYIEDYEWIRDQCKKCSEVGVAAITVIDLKQNGQEMFGVRLSGVSANMAKIENKTIVEGRFILPSEVDRSAAVCVIGYNVKQKLFAGVDPIGRTLKIRNLNMTVVGVEEKRGSMLGQSFDEQVYIPITTYGKLYGRRQSLQIHGSAAGREQVQQAIEEARGLMRIRHKLKPNEEDDFGLVDVEQINNQVDEFTAAIALVVTPITLISLLVGGIVVMNMMLVSVTERTFEIGLRKALGAKRSHILLQFLIESVLLASFGGLFGLLAAVPLAWLIELGTEIPMRITPAYVLLSLAVSSGVGIVFGIYPAYRASKLSPIQALSTK
ncbi:MAG: ABC transporter permease [Acidobacteriota bacterium]|nr:ABC transporter permease [Blastocatellia bacterium]MDW8413576.1 ABC transporter permease [Acidobacteriota bacterium]